MATSKAKAKTTKTPRKTSTKAKVKAKAPDKDSTSESTPTGIPAPDERPVAPEPKVESAPKAETASKGSEVAEGPTAAVEQEAPQETHKTSGLSEGKVTMVPLDRIDLDDHTFRFRIDIESRLRPLVQSIAAEGIHTPVVVRGKGKGRNKRFQIVSGFRRCTAATKLGLESVPVLVRDDLDDEAAFRSSAVENVARGSLDDLSRALLLKEYKDRGHGTEEEAADLLRLTARQQRTIRSYLDLPTPVKDALATGKITAGHAVALRKATDKHPTLTLPDWIKRVEDDGLSVRGLQREIRKEHGGKVAKGFGSLFAAKGTMVDKGVFRFAPVKIAVREMSAADKDKLRAELRQILEALG